MIVACIRYYEKSNQLDSTRILANSIAEAEEYLRTLKRNGIYKIENLNIQHSYVLGEATNFKVFSRDEKGMPLVLDWKNKQNNSSGRVDLWTELPKSIRESLEKIKNA